MTTATERLADSTAVARSALTDAITGCLPELDQLRDATQAAYRQARAADATAAECMRIIRTRIPSGRKADPDHQSRVSSDRQWQQQQEMDAKRDALSREDAVRAFDAAYAALGVLDVAHAAYVEATARWDDAAEQLTAAVMTSGAPWTPDPPAFGMAVLTVDRNPCGCSVDGRTFTAAAPLPDPLTDQDRRVIHDHALFFQHTWTAPPPLPPPPPKREPTPWDPRPAASTVDPEVWLARANGASHV